jgi:hypothetical protein
MRPVAPQDYVIVPHVTRPVESRQVRVMPVADSILWSPAVASAQRPALPVFLAQPAVRRIHDRLATVSNGLGIGLLTGRRHTCARSGVVFVVIDGALPLPALAHEDEPMATLTEGLRTAATGIEIFGWYRGHSGAEATLTPADVEAHTELFGEGPSIAVVVAGRGESGGVFRQTSSPAWPLETMPFYELLADPGARSDGLKQTILKWRNYRASEPTVRPGASAAELAATAARQVQVLFPDDEEDEPEVQPVAHNNQWVRPFVKPAAYAASALGGAALVLVLSGLVGSRGGTSANGNGNGADPATQAAALAVLDRRADSLTAALTAFNSRARMFDARQMACTGLQRGLQQVEDGWLAYNIARREATAPFDAARDTRDRSLYADVRSVELRFERSACNRP